MPPQLQQARSGFGMQAQNANPNPSDAYQNQNPQGFPAGNKQWRQQPQMSQTWRPFGMPMQGGGMAMPFNAPQQGWGAGIRPPQGYGTDNRGFAGGMQPPQRGQFQGQGGGQQVGIGQPAQGFSNDRYTGFDYGPGTGMQGAYMYSGLGQQQRLYNSGYGGSGVRGK